MFGEQGSQDHDPSIFADGCRPRTLQQIENEVWQTLKREHVKTRVAFDFRSRQEAPFDLVSSLSWGDKDERVSYRRL